MGGRDARGMVQDPKDPNGPLMQYREGDRREQGELAGGRLPYEGEVIGNKLPPYEVTGLDALSPLLMHVDFPVTKERLAERIGGARVALDKTRTISVREVIDRTAPNEFRSSGEVEEAVKRIWQQLTARPDRGSHHRQDDNLTGRKPN